MSPLSFHLARYPVVQESHSSWPILPNLETGHFTAIVDGKSHQIGSNAIKEPDNPRQANLGEKTCFSSLQLIRPEASRDFGTLPHLCA